MKDGAAGGHDAYAGVGKHVHTERAQPLDERHRPLQGHLLPALGQHHVQALQHDDDVIIRRP